MTEQEVYIALKDKMSKGYKINEIIPFSYPVRRIVMDVMVNKQPDSSLLKVYSVLLRAIQSGLNQQNTLFSFLGMGQTDEFIFRELFTLREKGYLDLISDKWFVTPDGESFIQNNNILQIEEEEEYEFLIDAVSGDVWSKYDYKTEKQKLTKSVQPKLTAPKKSDDLVQGKYQQLADIYKRDHRQEAYLIGYEENEIKKDYDDYLYLWLIEYVPAKNTDSESFLEIRSYKDLRKDKHLSDRFNAEYRDCIAELTNSERFIAEEFISIPEQLPSVVQPEIADFENLTIWETKERFIKALKEVNHRVLIESPWIKRATLEYLPLFDQILKAGKQLIILYGISENDEHDYQTLKRVEELQQRYSDNFTLIHLPTHFSKQGSRLTGTHRKLIIKDNDYYISGSFNFLSFGKNEKQQVANEESTLFTKNVNQRWEKVLKEYELKG